MYVLKHSLIRLAKEWPEIKELFVHKICVVHLEKKCVMWAMASASFSRVMALDTFSTM
jgi:hypothetical protein